jgi:hypothetical protein
VPVHRRGRPRRRARPNPRRTPRGTRHRRRPRSGARPPSPERRSRNECLMARSGPIVQVEASGTPGRCPGPPGASPTRSRGACFCLFSSNAVRSRPRTAAYRAFASGPDTTVPSANSHPAGAASRHARCQAHGPSTTTCVSCTGEEAAASPCRRPRRSAGRRGRAEAVASRVQARRTLVRVHVGQPHADPPEQDLDSAHRAQY